MARERYLNDPIPKTIHVSSKTFGGSIVIINEEDFNAKDHVRVNEQGQELNEHGRVMNPVPIAGPEAVKQDTKSVKGTKAE